MSLVDTTTGEVVDLLDAGQALALVKKIGGQLDRVNVETGSLVELVADALKGKAWVSLGYGSWVEMVEALRWEFRPATTTDRAALSLALRESGMSLRAIGKVVGANHQTVANDLSKNRHLPETGQVNEPEQVHATDGKTYPATRPPLATNSRGEGDDDTGSDGEIGGPELPESELSPKTSTPPETVGLTGETVEQTEPQSPAPVSPTRRLVTVHDFLEPVKSSWLTGVDPAVFWGLNNPDMADTFLMWIDSMTAYGQQLRAAQPNHLRLVGGTE